MSFDRVRYVDADSGNPHIIFFSQIKSTDQFLFFGEFDVFSFGMIICMFFAVILACTVAV